jgi:hypothetical protein
MKSNYSFTPFKRNHDGIYFSLSMTRNYKKSSKAESSKEVGYDSHILSEADLTSPEETMKKCTIRFIRGFNCARN